LLHYVNSNGHANYEKTGVKYNVNLFLQLLTDSYGAVFIFIQGLL